MKPQKLTARALGRFLENHQLPLLTPAIFYVLIVSLIIVQLPQIMIMTDGGPNRTQGYGRTYL